MAWKSLTIELGEKYKLDAPNDKLWIKATPMMWLSGNESTSIMARLSEDEGKVAKLESQESEEAVKIRLDGLYAIFPKMVTSWNLKDPESEQEVPPPAKLEDVSYIRSLPVQIIQEVCDQCINFGQEREPVVGEVPLADPDEGDNAAKAIPFENERSFETQSSPAPDLTALSTNSGSSIS